MSVRLLPQAVNLLMPNNTAESRKERFTSSEGG
jgi:hypothetical protein